MTCCRSLLGSQKKKAALHSAATAMQGQMAAPVQQGSAGWCNSAAQAMAVGRPLRQAGAQQVAWSGGLECVWANRRSVGSPHEGRPQQRGWLLAGQQRAHRAWAHANPYTGAHSQRLRLATSCIPGLLMI